ncbi:hypothetical protein [Deinococcus sp. UYEF24]
MLLAPAALKTAGGRAKILLSIFKRPQIEADLTGESFGLRLTNLMLQLSVILTSRRNRSKRCLQLGSLKQTLSQKNMPLSQGPAVFHQVGEPTICPGSQHKLTRFGTDQIEHFFVKRVELRVALPSHPAKLIVPRFHQVSSFMFSSI